LEDDVMEKVRTTHPKDDNDAKELNAGKSVRRLNIM